MVVKFGELRSKLFPQLDYQDKLSRGLLINLSHYHISNNNYIKGRLFGVPKKHLSVHGMEKFTYLFFV